MGQYLADNELRPDLILCSPALRTRDTLAKLLPYLGGIREIRFLPDLYEQMAADYIGIIGSFGADAENLMVIGHNSATHETAVALAADNPGQHFPALAMSFPTAAMAIFSTNTPWPDIGPANVVLENYIRPRPLREQHDTDAHE